MAGRGGGGARPGRRPRLHVVVASQGARRPRPEGQRHAVHPSPAGRRAVGIISLAVLGVGVSYALKGIRYLLLKPSLAQLRWSNLLGLSPSAAWVLRHRRPDRGHHRRHPVPRRPRSAGRDTRRLLAVDHRPPVLYLRSFGDDKVPLATIASARRPFFELFSFRGGTRSRSRSPGSSPPTDPSSRWAGRGQSLASLGAAASTCRTTRGRSRWPCGCTARVQSSSPPGDPGLRWEVSQVVAGGHLDKAVFVFPPLEGGALARRWEFTSTALAAAGARSVHSRRTRCSSTPPRWPPTVS